MKYFEQAQENFRRSNFYKSLEFFELSLKTEPLSREMKLLCCEKIEKINELVERSSDPQLLEFLADNYFELEDFQKSFDFYSKLFEKTGDENFLKQQYISLRNSGSVSESLSIARKYLEVVTSYKFIDTALEFLEGLQLLIQPEEMSTWRVRLFILSGNIDGLIQELKGWTDYSSEDRKALLEMVLELTNHNSKYWHSSTELTSLFWKYLNNEESLITTPKKRLIKLLIDYWLTQEKDPDLLTETLNLSFKYNFTVVGHEIAKFSGDAEKIDYFLDLMPREAFLEDSYDFGEDLFGDGDIEEAKSIERDINFLVKSGRKAEAIKLAYELERIDPENELVKKLVDRDLIKEPNADLKRVKDLFTELQRYTSSQEQEIDYASEYKTMVKHYDKSYIQENYEDMIIGFNLLNLYEVSIQICEMVNRALLTEREHVNLNYLLAETYQLNGNFFKMRDLCEDTLAELPLIEGEITSFLYLRGEAYFHLGNFPYALSIFRSLIKIHPNYRLSEQRISSIEANK